MGTIRIAPYQQYWLMLLLLLLLLPLLGIVSSSSSVDQYLTRNQYQSFSHEDVYPLQHVGFTNNNNNDDNDDFDKWQVETDFASGNENPLIFGLAAGLADQNSNKNKNERINKRKEILHKRSSESQESKENKEAPSLQELLKHWGIDTSDPVHRGDIQVTEAPRNDSGRGDVPAGFVHSSRHRSRRQAHATSRKLLWQHNREDAALWGYGEGEDYQGDQPQPNDYDAEQQQRQQQHLQRQDEERRYTKGGHRRKHHRPANPPRSDNEVRRVEDPSELRQPEQQQEEEERRRVEEERRRQEDERRRQDAERRRQDDDEDERRRQWEEQERRKLEEQDQEERRRRPETKSEQPPRRDEGRKVPVTQVQPLQPEDQRLSYEERMQQWRKMKEEYDRLVRERQSGRDQNRTKTPEELENERKLQDYIRRNTPIDVTGRRGSPNRGPSPANQRRPGDEERGSRPSPPSRNSQYEEQRRQEEERRRRLQEEEEKERLRQQQQEEEEEERRQRLQQQQLEQEEEERRRRQREREEEKRRQQQQQQGRPSEEEEEQRMRENEEVRRAELQKQREQEQRRKQTEEQSRRLYEEQRRKYEETRNRNPNGPVDERRRGEVKGVKRPHHLAASAVKGENGKNENSESGVERTRDPESSNKRRPGMEGHARDWRTRPEQPTTILPSETETRGRPDDERLREPRPDDWREWQPPRTREPSASRQPESNPESRRPSEKGWKEEENHRRYLELKKNSDTVYNRHGIDYRNNRPPMPPPIPPPIIATTLIPNDLITTEDEGLARRPEQDEEEKNEEERDEEVRRLKGVPVTGGTRVSSNGSSSNDNNNNNTPPAVSLRGGFADGIDFPGFSPGKRGPEINRFPAPVTQRPPAKSPKPCVWAIVVCCREPRSIERETRCFEATDCLSWDSNRCRAENVRAANRELMQFYLRSRASFL